MPFGASAQAPAPQIVFTGNGISIVNGDATPRTQDGTDFGVTSVGVPVSRVFVVGNTGTANLSVTDVSVPPGFSFSAPGGLPGAVFPGGAMLLLVTCDAKSPDSYTGFLSIVSNDPDEGRAGFEIACRVNGSPDIDVAGNSTPITNGDATPSPNDATDFGTTQVNLPVTHTFRVSNRGVADLTIGAVTPPAGFTALTTLPATIPPSQSADLQVRCDATSEDTYAGNVSILNSDPDENPFSFRIRCVVGDGVPEFNPGPGDLPSATVTVVTSPVTITTPPPSSGGSNSGGDSGGNTGTGGSVSNQGGGSQVNATVGTATATPPRATSTAIVPTRVAGSTQGIFAPPSTGEGSGSSGHDLPLAAVVVVAVAVLVALGTGIKLRSPR